MRRDHPLALGALVTLLCATGWVCADPPPAWWTDTTNGTAIINSSATPNNYGVLNIGQLKYTAYQAQKYLNQYFEAAGGAGADIDALVANFTANTSTNFEPATLGQLEYVAKPFYDRLNYLGFDTKASLEAFGYTDAFWANDTTPPYYPWHTPPGPGDGNYTNWLDARLKLANVGQLKMVFSFDLSNYRPANNNLFGFYIWANNYGLDITNGSLVNATYTDAALGNISDNVTYWTKFQADEYPFQYVYPANMAANLSLNVTQGSGQSGDPGAMLSEAIVLRVGDVQPGNSSNITYLANMPIHYVVEPGDGLVTVGGSNSTSGYLLTDANGNITMNYTMGNASAVQWIHFTAPSTTAFADAIFTLNGSAGGGTPSPGIDGNLSFSTDADPSTADLQPYLAETNASYNETDNYVHNTVTWDAHNIDANATYIVERQTDGQTWHYVGSVDSTEGEADGDAYSFSVYDGGNLSGGFRFIYRITLLYNNISAGYTETALSVPLLRYIASTVATAAGSKSNYYPELDQYITFPTAPKMYLNQNISVEYDTSWGDGTSGGALTNTYVENDTLSTNTTDTVTTTSTSISDFYNLDVEADATTHYESDGWDGDSWSDSTVDSSLSRNDTYYIAPSADYYNGDWSGTYADEGDDYYNGTDHYSSDSGSVDYPAFSPGDVISDVQFDYPNSTINATHATDNYYGYNITIDLANEYTTAELLSDVGNLAVGDPPDPDGNIGVYYYPFDAWGGYPEEVPLFMLAESNLAADEINFDISAAKYRMVYNPVDSTTSGPASPATYSWCEIYVPYTDVAPADTTGNETILNVRTMTPNSDGYTDIYSVDGRDLEDNTTIGDGLPNYGSIDIMAYPQPQVTDTTLGYSTLDAYETQRKIPIGYDIGSFIDLLPNSFGSFSYGYDGPIDHITVTWSSGLTLYEDSYPSPVLVSGNGSATFDEGGVRLYPVASNPDTDYQVEISYYGANDTLIDSQNLVFTTDTDNQYSASSDEVTGAEYRKVALNGRPLPDGKPQTASESDQQDEETFVDALTLGLRHNVSDVYEKIPGTDTPLTVNRVYGEEIWSNRQGLRPHERPDEPFGPGWTTNLVASVRWEANTDSVYPNIYATDENGNQYHFLGVWNETGNLCTFVPYPTGKHEKNPYEATLTMDPLTGNETIANTTLTLTKKFGSTVKYEHADLDDVYSSIAADRLVGSDTTNSYSYFRAETVTGRGGYGNLTYAYAANDTLVPETIKATAGNDTSMAGNTTISILQNSTGHITDVWDSDNICTHYSYDNTTITDPSDSYNLTLLHQVTQAYGTDASSNVTYTYALTTEDDTTPRPDSSNIDSPDYNPGTTYYHLNVTDIEDQNLNTYHFTYHKHYEDGLGNDTVGFQSYNSYGGYYPTPGRPLMVANISLTDGSSNTTIPLGEFQNDSYVEIGSGNTGLALDTGSRRRTVITDADGHVSSYTWSNGSVMMQDIPSVIAAESPNSFGELVAWGNLTIAYYANSTAFSGNSAIGSETYQFDKNAGMALAAATDFSGHTTTYAHGDAWSVADLTTYIDALPGVYDSANNGYSGYYDDPTSQTRYATVNGTANTSISKTFHYNSMRLMDETVDENGRLTHYDFDSGNLGLRVDEKRYDGNTTSSNLVSETDFTYGNTTFPTVVTKKVVQALGGDDPSWVGNLTVSYDLDTYGRVSAEHVDPDGMNLTTSYTYSVAGDKLTETDPRGNVTNFTYDARHRLINVIYPGDPPAARSYSYDGRGNLLDEYDELGHKTVKTYDALNRVLTVTRVMDGSNELLSGLGNLTTTNTYTNTSCLNSTMDPNGNTTYYSYDGLNRLTETTTPVVPIGYNSTSGGAASNTSLHTYYYYNGTNPGGNAFDSSSFKPTSTVDVRGNTTTIAYDERYLPISETVQFATSGSKYAVTHKTYDAVGNLRTLAASADGSSTVGSLGGNVETTTYNYDALDRLVQTTFTDNSTAATNYTSTGLAWQSTDALGRQTDKIYDAAGRPVIVISPDKDSGSVTFTGNYDTGNGTWSNISAGNSSVTTTQYDANSNPTQVTNPVGQIAQYNYDARNRKIEVIEPEVPDWSSGGNGTMVNPTVTTAYDAAGNPVEVTDARGNTTVTLYDSANRPTYTFTPAVDYVAANGTLISGRSMVTARMYDRNGNTLQVLQGTANAAGTAGGAAFDRAMATNTYDALNRLQTTEDAQGLLVQYGYDEAGNRMRVTDGGGRTTTFAYDGLNRLTTETAPGSRTTSYAYNALNKTSRTDANGHTTNYAYDSLNRLTGVTYVSAPSTLDNSGQSLPVYVSHGRTMHYDDAGELIAVAENYTNNSTVSNVAYAYDGLGRLIAENQGAAFNGTYLNATFGTLPGNLASNTSNGVTNLYTYDAAGNRLTVTYANSRGDALTLSSNYDALNRLANVTEGNRTETYRYDRNGNRVTLIQGSNSTISTTYDALNRAEEFIGKDAIYSHTLYDYDLAFDEFGNLRQQSEAYPYGSISNRTVTLDYDQADRLVDEIDDLDSDTYHYGSGPSETVRSYKYDGSSNRLEETVTYATGGGNASEVVDLAFSYRNDDALQTCNITLADYTGNLSTVTRNYTVDADGSVTQAEIHYSDSSGGPVDYKSNFAYDYENRLLQRITTLMDTDAYVGYWWEEYWSATVYDNVYDYRSRQVAEISDNTSTYYNEIFHSGYSSVSPATHTWRLYSGGLSEREYDLGSNTAWSLNLTAANLTVQYIRGSDWGGGVGGVLHSLKPSGNSTAAAYYHYDGRGDVTDLTDNGGNLTYQAAYTADGVHNPGQWGAGGYGAAESSIIGYDTGFSIQANTKLEEVDNNDFGYINDGQRYRDMLSGRYLTKDPLGFPDGPNPYIYVNDNPWTKFDPEGLSAYSDMDDAAANQYGQGGLHTVAAAGIVVLQQAWNMFSLGTASKNGAIQDQVDSGKLSLGKGVTAMVGNGVVAGASLAVGGEAFTAVKGAGGVILAGAAGGAAQSTTQVVGNHIVAGATGTPQATLGQDATQIATTTALGGALGVAGKMDEAAAANAAAKAPPTSPTSSAQSIWIQNKYGRFMGSYDPTTQTLKVGIINSNGEPGQNYSTELYKQAIAQAQGPVKNVTGFAGGDNAAALNASGGDINATPRAKSLAKLGYTDHSYDPATKQMTSSQPDSASTGN